MRPPRIVWIVWILLLALAGAGARAQRTVWTQRQPRTVAFLSPLPTALTDSAGNTYVSGSFQGSFQLGAFTVSAADPGTPDSYLACYNAAGAVQWLVRAGVADATASRPGAEFITALALDSAGHLYVGGRATRPGFTFGPAVLDSAGHYLAKLDAATGQMQWLHRLEADALRLGPPTAGGLPIVAIRGLACDGRGRMYLGAAVSDVATLGAVPVGLSTGLIVARLDGTGAFEWVTPVVNSSSRSPLLQLSSLTVDRFGGVAVSGVFRGRLAVGALGSAPLTLVSTDSVSGATNGDAFIARLHPNGTPRWGQLLDGPGYQKVNALRFDAAGSLYATGRAYAGVRVGGLTSTAGVYLARFSATGSVQWLRSPAVNGGNATGVALTLDRAGNPYLAGWYDRSVRFGSYALSSITMAGNSSLCPFVAAYDPAGAVRWAKTASDQGVGDALFYGIGTDANDNLYVAGNLNPGSSGYVASSRAAIGLPLPSADSPASRSGDYMACSRGFDGQHLDGAGNFVLRLSPAAQLDGLVYLDENGNGYRDTAETAFPRPVLVADVPRNFSATSDPLNGYFSVFVDTGMYALTLPLAPRHYTVQEGASGYSGYFTASGQVQQGKNFGLAPTPGRPDLRVTLTPYSGLRAGLPLRYRARLENVGTTALGPVQLAVTLDSSSTIIGTIPAASQSTGQTRTWTVPTLPRFAIRNYDIIFNLPVTARVGTQFTASVVASSLITDSYPDDNLDTLRQRVVASFDPNDLTVNHTELSLRQVAVGELLDYLIRFENLGTDTAFAVTIVDSLPSAMLQLGTVQLVGASHNCQWQITGRGVLTMRFPGIQLPNQAVDALRSQGFVRFRVRPRTTLRTGMLIPGIAHITFDFNAPLATNHVATIIGSLLPTAAPAARSPESTSWTLFPNPATATVTLAAETPRAGRATVHILDAVGRAVRSLELPVATGTVRLSLDVRDLPSGVYAVRLTLPGRPATVQRLVMQ